MSRIGWIKLYRKLLDDPLWKDCKDNQKIIMITLLLMANHETNTWIFGGEPYKVEPGEFVTSLNSLSRETGYSVSIVRNTLEKLKKHDFLTYQSTNKNRLIRINNWGKYQDKKEDDNKQEDKQLASDSQAPSKQLATNKNDKNDKNEKKNSKEKFEVIINSYTENDDLKKSILEFVEYRKSIKKNLTELALNKLLNKLSKISESDLQKIEIINNSIVNGWSGVFELNEKQKKDIEESEEPKKKRKPLTYKNRGYL